MKLGCFADVVVVARMVLFVYGGEMRIQIPLFRH